MVILSYSNLKNFFWTVLQFPFSKTKSDCVLVFNVHFTMSILRKGNRDHLLVIKQSHSF